MTTTRPVEPAPAPGAYGLRLRGLEAPRALLADPPADWPAVAVSVHAAPAAGDGATRTVDARRARLDLPGGRRLELDRAARQARFHGPALAPDEIAHPYLGPVAT